MEKELETNAQVITPEELFSHWQGHRNLTRRVIEAFPEDKLFEYSIGGMRPFADMVKEITGIAGAGIRGVATGEWTMTADLDYHSGKSLADSKEELLKVWDQVTDEMSSFWPKILTSQFRETIVAFGEWEGQVSGILLYWIDNEIHHRAQGYVYLRSLGIEPPAFWDRN